MVLCVTVQTRDHKMQIDHASLILHNSHKCQLGVLDGERARHLKVK